MHYLVYIRYLWLWFSYNLFGCRTRHLDAHSRHCIGLFIPVRRGPGNTCLDGPVLNFDGHFLIGVPKIFSVNMQQLAIFVIILEYNTSCTAKNPGVSNLSKMNAPMHSNSKFWVKLLLLSMKTFTQWKLNENIYSFF